MFILNYIRSFFSSMFLDITFVGFKIEVNRSQFHTPIRSRIAQVHILPGWLKQYLK